MWKRLEEKSGKGSIILVQMDHLQLMGDYIYIIYIFNLYMCVWIKWGGLQHVMVFAL